MPLGSKRRSTVARRRAPAETATRRPLTRTLADVIRVPLRARGSRIANRRRLAQRRATAAGPELTPAAVIPADPPRRARRSYGVTTAVTVSTGRTPGSVIRGWVVSARTSWPPVVVTRTS